MAAVSCICDLLGLLEGMLGLESAGGVFCCLHEHSGDVIDTSMTQLPCIHVVAYLCSASMYMVFCVVEDLHLVQLGLLMCFGV